MIAKDLITGSIPVLKLSDTIPFALQCMEEYKLLFLPVNGNSGYLGLVSEKECLAASETENELSEAGIPLLPVSANENAHIFQVLDLMFEQNIFLIPVVSNDNQYLGSITPGEMLKGFSFLLSVRQPGGIIELEVPEKDYLLSEIVTIVESNDTRIISLSTSPSAHPSTLMVTLMLNRMDIGPVLQTFNRYNYSVKGSWSKEDSYSANLHERFDALMNYLSI
jgi:CBS domain-containing protein